MIILLNGHSLTAKDRFNAEKFALSLSERQSTATITIGPEAPVISTGDWLKDEDNPGAGIVWRVKSIDTDYATDTRTLNCEHAINTLKDLILFGEVKPGTMAGNSGASVCTAIQAARYVLNRQSDWVLGSFGYSKSAPYNFNSDALFEALETISSSLLTPFWTYDFSTYPFRLNITQPSDAVQCEMRMDRNIRTLKKSIDRTRMFTRFYPIGKNNKHISGSGYVSRNENLYGVISNVETDNDKDTEDKLRAWAEERLQNHAEPLVTVNISGLELSEATGEPLDRLVLGTVCRVPLPEYNTTITERITKLSWSDKVADPESVTITLANQVQDVASIVNNLTKSSGKKNKSHAKQSEEDHAWMVDTNDHIGLVAEAVAGEGAATDWSRVAQVMVDGQGIHQRVTKTEGDIVTQEARIEVNENSIRQEVTDRKSADTTLNGRITVEAGKISQVVEAVGKDGQVTAASIVLAINQSSGESEAKIDAQRVYIGNQKSTTVINGKCSLSDVTANYISGKISLIATMTAQDIDANSVKIRPVAGMGAINVATAYNGSSCTVSGGVVTLRLAKMNGSFDEYTFDHAAPTSLAGSWSGRTYTVTASPQGTSKSETMYPRPVSSQGAAYADVYVATTDGSNWTTHGDAVRLTMEATGQRVDLKDGNGAVYAQLTVPNPTVTTTGSWSDKTYTVQAKIGGTVVSTQTENVDVNPVSSQGGDYTDVYVATPSGSGFTNHGSAKRLTLSAEGLTVKLKNGTSVLAMKTISLSGTAIVFDCEDQINPQTDKNDKPLTATAKYGTSTIATADQIIHMTQGNWQLGKKAVNVRMTNDQGKLITRLWVTIPSIVETCSNPAQRAFQITASCGGSSVTYTLKVNSTGGIESFTRN